MFRFRQFFFLKRKAQKAKTSTLPATTKLIGFVDLEEFLVKFVCINWLFKAEVFANAIVAVAINNNKN